MARGEAPRETPVPVPSRGPLVCRMEAISFLFDLIVINIINILGLT